MMFVSVVIPLYNKQSHIKDALDSVALQSHTHFEVIVVNDMSTDGGAELARSYPDARVRVIELNGHGGAAAARNAGIMAARYPLIAFLDADDKWYPDFLDTVLSLFNRFPDAGMIGTAYDLQKKSRIRPVKTEGLPRRFEGLMPSYFKSVLGAIPVISSAVMVPRTVFDSVGLFAPGERLGEDQDMWCRIALKFPVAYSTKRCAVYRLDAPGSLCISTTVTEEYPVMSTVRHAIKTHPELAKWLKRYEAKLTIDYAVHLIRGCALRRAWQALNKAGFIRPRERLRAEYYYFRAWLKCGHERD